MRWYRAHATAEDARATAGDRVDDVHRRRRDLARSHRVRRSQAAGLAREAAIAARAREITGRRISSRVSGRAAPRRRASIDCRRRWPRATRRTSRSGTTQYDNADSDVDTASLVASTTSCDSVMDAVDHISDDVAVERDWAIAGAQATGARRVQCALVAGIDEAMPGLAGCPGRRDRELHGARGVEGRVRDAARGDHLTCDEDRGGQAEAGDDHVREGRRHVLRRCARGRARSMAPSPPIARRRSRDRAPRCRRRARTTRGTTRCERVSRPAEPRRASTARRHRVGVGISGARRRWRRAPAGVRRVPPP